MSSPIDITKQYETESGLPVHIYWVGAAEVHGAIDNEGRRTSCIWTCLGGILGTIFPTTQGQNHPWNLVEVKPKHTRKLWINMYPEDRERGGVVHTDKKIADIFRTSSCIACVPIEVTFTEGDGL